MREISGGGEGWEGGNSWGTYFGEGQVGGYMGGVDSPPPASPVPAAAEGHRGTGPPRYCAGGGGGRHGHRGGWGVAGGTPVPGARGAALTGGSAGPVPVPERSRYRSGAERGPRRSQPPRRVTCGGAGRPLRGRPIPGNRYRNQEPAPGNRYRNREPIPAPGTGRWERHHPPSLGGSRVPCPSPPGPPGCRLLLSPAPVSIPSSSPPHAGVAPNSLPGPRGTLSSPPPPPPQWPVPGSITCIPPSSSSPFA